MFCEMLMIGSSSPANSSASQRLERGARSPDEFRRSSERVCDSITRAWLPYREGYGKSCCMNRFLHSACGCRDAALFAACGDLPDGPGTRPQNMN